MRRNDQHVKEFFKSRYHKSPNDMWKFNLSADAEFIYNRLMAYKPDIAISRAYLINIINRPPSEDVPRDDIISEYRLRKAINDLGSKGFLTYIRMANTNGKYRGDGEYYFDPLGNLDPDFAREYTIKNRLNKDIKVVSKPDKRLTTRPRINRVADRCHIRSQDYSQSQHSDTKDEFETRFSRENHENKNLNLEKKDAHKNNTEQAIPTPLFSEEEFKINLAPAEIAKTRNLNQFRTWDDDAIAKHLWLKEYARRKMSESMVVEESKTEVKDHFGVASVKRVGGRIEERAMGTDGMTIFPVINVYEVSTTLARFDEENAAPIGKTVENRFSAKGVPDIVTKEDAAWELGQQIGLALNAKEIFRWLYENQLQLRARKKTAAFCNALIGISPTEAVRGDLEDLVKTLFFQTKYGTLKSRSNLKPKLTDQTLLELAFELGKTPELSDKYLVKLAKNYHVELAVLAPDSYIRIIAELLTLVERCLNDYNVYSYRATKISLDLTFEDNIKAPDPLAKNIINQCFLMYHKYYLEHYREEPVKPQSIERVWLATRCIEACSGDLGEFEEALKRFFASGDRFTQKAKHPLNLFTNQFYTYAFDAKVIYEYDKKQRGGSGVRRKRGKAAGDPRNKKSFRSTVTDITPPNQDLPEEEASGEPKQTIVNTLTGEPIGKPTTQGPPTLLLEESPTNELEGETQPNAPEPEEEQGFQPFGDDEVPF